MGRRQQHHDCRAAVRLDPGSGRAGLSVRLDEAHHYDVEVHDGQASVIARIGPVRQRVAGHPVPAGPLTLAVDIRTAGVLPPAVTRTGGADDGPTGAGAHGPDTIAFSVHLGEERLLLAELDGRYLSTEVAAGFTGRVIGMYVTEGGAVFDRFDYEGGRDLPG
ncbi:hypothetical protein [Streptosporangium pseudovulgare]|uniref:Beta-xylosidase C-terminal Concanavalin A-like domain-containing protein n=1 Tax=Streptosporangium pseudovulgare TaxID=35765 RepID=A0ABQ2RI55_9ACTN|nr:hypothetical protein [Streptosporangium pseudovulgare]GGQ27885.1 hypothetical protein GCM10010140_67570 [Streptosporangium pseudovulgare]